MDTAFLLLKVLSLAWNWLTKWPSRVTHNAVKLSIDSLQNKKLEGSLGYLIPGLACFFHYTWWKNQPHCHEWNFIKQSNDISVYVGPLSECRSFMIIKALPSLLLMISLLKRPRCAKCKWPIVSNCYCSELMKLITLCNFHAIIFTLKGPSSSSTLYIPWKDKEREKGRKSKERTKSDFKESLGKNYIQGLRAIGV